MSKHLASCVEQKRAGRNQSGYHGIVSKCPTTHKYPGGEIMLTSLSSGVALMQMLSLVTSPSVSPVRRLQACTPQAELLTHPAYWNGQYTSAVSFAGKHRNMSMPPGMDPASFPLQITPWKTVTATKHSAFYRLRLHSCAPILVLEAQYS